MTWRITFASLLAVISATVFVEQDTQARPLYHKVWKRVYERPNKASCALCHPTKPKSTLNVYGQRLKKELGARNVKDEEVIEAAIRKIPIRFP